MKGSFGKLPFACLKVTLPMLFAIELTNCFNRITYKIISNRIRIRSLFFALFAHAIDSSADKAMLGWLYGAKTAIEIVETIKREMVTVSSKIHGKIPKKNISEIIERIKHPANVLAWRPLVRVRSEQKLI